MRKSIFFWLYFVVSIILATYFAVRIITSQMGRGPISSVHQITTYGTNAKDDEIIKMSLGVSNGYGLRSLDLHLLSNRVSEIPGVKQSAVRLLPNGDIIVNIKKHHIIATWSDGVSYYPLSSDGTKVNTPVSERNSNSLVFMGELPEQMTNISEIINAASALSPYIDYITNIESRRWNIHTKNGTVIYLPEKNPTAALSKINLLNNTHKLLSRKLDIIDMRDNARILIKEKR